MKKSKLEAAETRQRIVKAAAAEFRRKGINNTGLNEVMAAAGLTNWSLKLAPQQWTQLGRRTGPRGARALIRLDSKQS